MNEHKITLVKGDTLSLNITINDIDIELIDKVYFTCEKQGINKQLNYIDNQFNLSISPETTILFYDMICDYDITIIFKNGETMTTIYRSSFIVLPKTNSLDIYDENPYIVVELKELPVANDSNKNKIVIYNDEAYICVEKEGE